MVGDRYVSIHSGETFRIVRAGYLLVRMVHEDPSGAGPWQEIRRADLATHYRRLDAPDRPDRRNIEPA